MAAESPCAQILRALPIDGNRMLLPLHALHLKTPVTTLDFNANACRVGEYVELFYPHPDPPVAQAAGSDILGQRFD